jgi:Fis family transcriptional regulator
MVRMAKKDGQFRDANGLSDCVREAMDNYFADLDGHEACDLYELVLSQVEKPLFEVVMKNTRGNVSQAAVTLGMNRGTLRSRLKKYGLDK